MFRAVWSGAVLADSGHTVKVEGNHCFPPGSLQREYFATSPTTSTCPWKGQARYHHVRVDGTVNRDAAWYDPQPSPAASKIAGYVAFWHGVRVEHVTGAGEEAPGGTTRSLTGWIRAGLHRIGAR
jgi:uncharacterized protein (DUF427 family)